MKIFQFSFFLFYSFIIVILSLSLTSCSTLSPSWVTPIERDQLSVNVMRGGTFKSAVNNLYFLPINPTNVRPHIFSGTLHFPETKLNTEIPHKEWLGGDQTLFPKFSIDFVSYGDAIIPKQRGIIYSGEKGKYLASSGSLYNIIIGTGKVWREAADDEFSRASFPFTLFDNFSGQARNGVAMFVFNETFVSKIAVQICQEISLNKYGKGNAVALVPVRFIPHEFIERNHIIKEYKTELANRLPVLPWSELPYEGSLEKQFNEGAKWVDLSAAALIMDRKIYLQAAYTRTGIYPYPAEMRHGVFSVTKSLVLGLAMLHLSEKYGPEVFDELISDFVPVLSDNPDWKNVTFAHTLNMVTGTNGLEGGKKSLPFWQARTAIEKLKVINECPSSSVPSGKEFDYKSTNSFVLSYALNQYVKSKNGPNADYWRMVEKEVLEPIGIKNFAVRRTIEEPGELGIPFAANGSYPTIDDVAKISILLQNVGSFKGKQLLHREKTLEALSKTEWDGYEVEWHERWFVGYNRYKHSFRTHSNYVLNSCKISYSGMLGMGGNHILLFPSGLIAMRFSDQGGRAYDIGGIIKAAETIKSSCLKK